MTKSQIHITDLRIYPIKSIWPVSLSRSIVTEIGLQYDRQFAIINDANEVITGREFPKLLKIKATVNNGLKIRVDNGEPHEVSIAEDKGELIEVKHFGSWIKGFFIDHACNQAISALLGFPCRLVYMNTEIAREIQEKHGGQNHEKVSYADASPIHLISEESLVDLNAKLTQPVGMDRFRPNIVVKGCKPYEEDSWNEIVINDCRFVANRKTKRCVFTTVDPDSLKKHTNQEPLRTLSIHRNIEGGASFGVYFIPAKTGTLNVGDNIQIL